MEKQRETTAQNKLSKSRILRVIYIVLGFLSFAVGCVGIALPVLPTVPFFLLTSYCFAKGSQRFNDWFTATKLYKKYVSGFTEYHAMSIGGELFLLLFVSAMLSISCYLINSFVMSIVFPVLVAIKYSFFVFRIRTVSKQELIALKTKSNQIKENS